MPAILLTSFHNEIEQLKNLGRFYIGPSFVYYSRFGEFVKSIRNDYYYYNTPYIRGVDGLFGWIF